MRQNVCCVRETRENGAVPSRQQGYNYGMVKEAISIGEEAEGGEINTAYAVRA